MSFRHFWNVILTLDFILLVSAPHRPYEWELQSWNLIYFNLHVSLNQLLPRHKYICISLTRLLRIRIANPHRCYYPPPEVSHFLFAPLSLSSIVANYICPSHYMDSKPPTGFSRAVIAMKLYFIIRHKQNSNSPL